MNKLDSATEDAWEEHHKLLEDGLLDPDQPTLYAHLESLRARRAAGREFTPEERRIIRQVLLASEDQT